MLNTIVRPVWISQLLFYPFPTFVYNAHLRVIGIFKIIAFILELLVAKY